MRFSIRVSGYLAATLLFATAAFAFKHPEDGDLPNLDRRAKANARAEQPARQAAEAALRARIPMEPLERHAIVDSPSWIAARDGFLSGVNAGAEPSRVVKEFINEHALVFEHDGTAVDRARVRRQYTDSHNGLHTLAWEQEHEGIVVFEAVLKAHVSRNGELVNISSQFLPDPARAAANGRGNGAGALRPISAAEALGRATMEIGEDAALSATAATKNNEEGRARKQKLTSGAVRGEATAQLVWLPMSEESMRLCWKLWFMSRTRNEAFRSLVDAETGEVLVRHCLTDYISNASYRVFTGDSPTPLSPSYEAPGETGQPAAVSRQLITWMAQNTNASPLGWISDGVNETRGNNIDAHTDLDDNDLADLPRPQGSPNRVFDFPLNLSQAPSTYRNAAVANLFYWCNWMHDKLWALGFTEPAANFQNNNFGRGGIGGDAILAQAQDGHGVNNANFSLTDDDGEVCRLQMYVFTGPTPDKDGDFDTQIMIHEYVHGLSQRLVGAGTGLTQPQSKGMGEGWSDFYALALLSNSSQDVNGTFAKGAYAVENMKICGTASLPGGDNYYFGIRRYPYSTDLTKNPLTFKDIDSTQADPHSGIPKSPILDCAGAGEVHNQGEVWCSALLEVRANLIAKHGFAAGNQLALQLVTDGMKLATANPNFLQARDAILQADQVMNSAANYPQIWAGFAKRGMGFHATSPSSSTTIGVVESFEVPDKLRILPAVAIVVQGPVGGPFDFTSQAYTVSNTGPGSITWTGISQPPLELSLLSSTLAAGGKVTATATVNPAAAAGLAEGLHVRSVLFSNQSSGVVITRTFTFKVGLRPTPVEAFTGAGDQFDLDNQRLTFTPDGSSEYSVCRELAVSFPTAPAAGTTLTLADDDFEQITLSAGKTIPFYGGSYSSIFIGGNGYVTFGEGDASFTPSLAKHFELPRVSALFADLAPNSSGRVSWQQLSNRVALTWENVKLISAALTNSFQIELFFDGRIRVTYLRVDAAITTVGLSSGGGVPAGLVEANFSTADSCTMQEIGLFVPHEVTEGGGTLVNQGRVTIPVVAIVDTSISLASSDTTEITVPLSVIIPPGQTSAFFNITIQNDVILDGSQISYITASRPLYKSAQRVIHVHDNETTTLSVQLLQVAQEGSQPAEGRVRIPVPAADTIVVNVISSRPEELSSTVAFIPQGATSGVFSASAVDDNRIDGTQSVMMTAVVENWTSGAASFVVRDNESTNLMMTVTAFVNESQGTITNGGTLRLSGVLSTNLLVAVLSDDESEVRTPLFGVVIPAGQTNVSFPLFIQDDSSIDGLIIARIRAVAGGFRSATNFVWVFDNDGPPEPYNPYPPDESMGIPVTADLSWGRVEGDMVVNGNFEKGDLTGWTLDNTGGGSWVVNDGAFDPESTDGPLPPLAGAFSGLSQQAGNGTHVLYQDVVIPFGATSAMLSWSDRIHNHAPAFAGNQQFRVELRNPNDNLVLATLFSTKPGDALINSWSNRTANLAYYRGQTVRLAFVEDDGLGYLNVHLDNISLLAPASSPTSFDVYFGTNQTPTELVGSTAGASLSLPMLAGGTDYFWQVKARRGTSTNAGPIWHFTTEAGSSNRTLITFGSAWRYRNTGQNLGTAWTNLNYNDAAWGTGLGILGFGGKQDTTIGLAANGYITYYFRTKFNLFDPERVVSLTARLIRDDGAVVHINGMPAFENNMLRGEVFYDTQAANIISGLGETIPVTVDLDPKLLVDGTNIVAVEVHQRHDQFVFSPDLYFDLELKALVNTGNEAPHVTLINPPAFTLAHAPTNLVLQATIQDEVSRVIGATVEFYVDGVPIGQDTSTPFSFIWNNPAPGQYVLTAVAIDAGSLRGTSGPVHVTIAPATGTLVTLVPSGANWSYFDGAGPPATNWNLASYRVRWENGPAQLGYGDGDEATVINYGNDPVDKHITAWFRRSFTAPAVMSSLRVRVLRDDGAIVYLNGTQVLRNNMPAGTITANTLASSTVAGLAENVWVVSTTSPGLLTAGANVIAAEVHQASAASPDLSFDLELTGIGNVQPIVSITSPSSSNVFSADANVAISAAALDPYGSVSQVQFLANGVLIGTDVAAPHQFIWNSPPAGVHVLTAVAQDPQLARGTSAPVVITIAAVVSLAIERFGPQAELSWPDTAPGYVLQTATNLTSPISWQPITNAVQQSGGRFRVPVAVESRERYFRLRTP